MTISLGWLKCCLILIVFLAGCSRSGTLEGEVFIVTQNRDNVEMGLVEVRAYEESELDAHLGDMLNVAETRVSEISDKGGEWLDSLAAISSDYWRLQSEIQALQESLASGAPGLNVPTFYSYAEIASPNFSDGASVVASRDDISIKSNPDYDAEEISSVIVGDKGTVVDREGRYYKIQFADSRGWVNGTWLAPLEKYESWVALKSRRQQQRTNLEARRREANNKLSSAKTRFGDVTETRNALEDSLQSIIQEVTIYSRESYYLGDLPETEVLDKTNASGRFELTLQRERPYYIVARADRPNVDESYHWIVDYTLRDEKGELLLSNDNRGYLWNYINRNTELPLQRALREAKQGINRDNWSRVIYNSVLTSQQPD